MYKPSRSHGRRPSSNHPDISARIKKHLRRVYDSVLLTLVAVVTVYMLFLAVKVTRGYSQTQSGPEKVVRLQIVDGSGEAGMTRRAGEVLEEKSDSALAVEVVESKRFDRHKVTRSFLIAREEDRTGAELLAQRLGLDPDEVIYRPLANNRLFVTVTLVLGSDGLPPMDHEES